MKCNTAKCIKIAAIVLAGTFFMNTYVEASTRCQGNLILEQEDEAGKVAFYEDDTKYLENEIKRLQSQLGKLKGGKNDKK